MEQILQVVWDIDERTLKEYEEKLANRDPTQYIYYDPENGGIKAISNLSNELNYPFITVSEDDVNNIIKSNKPIFEYKVIFSPDAKEFVLVHITEEEDVLESINDIIYQYPFKIDISMPLEIDPNNDITAVQDYQDTCWKFFINPKLASGLQKRKLYFDNTHELYITASNDPNILYKTLRVPLKDLITNYSYVLPFDDLDYNETKISIYSRKLFSRYQYIKTKI